MTGRNTDNQIVAELAEIERQIGELKTKQFNGSSNNYSGIIKTSNTYTFNPSTSWDLLKGFLVRIVSDDVSLTTMTLDVRQASNNQPWHPSSSPTSFRRGFRFTTILNNKYESWFYYWDYGMEYPQLKITAKGIGNGNFNVIVEGVSIAW